MSSYYVRINIEALSGHSRQTVLFQKMAWGWPMGLGVAAPRPKTWPGQSQIEVLVATSRKGIHKGNSGRQGLAEPYIRAPPLNTTMQVSLLCHNTQPPQSSCRRPGPSCLWAGRRFCPGCSLRIRETRNILSYLHVCIYITYLQILHVYILYAYVSPTCDNTRMHVYIETCQFLMTYIYIYICIYICMHTRRDA